MLLFSETVFVLFFVCFFYQNPKPRFGKRLTRSWRCCLMEWRGSWSTKRSRWWTKKQAGWCRGLWAEERKQWVRLSIEGTILFSSRTLSDQTEDSMIWWGLRVKEQSRRWAAGVIVKQRGCCTVRPAGTHTHTGKEEEILYLLYTFSYTHFFSPAFNSPTEQGSFGAWIWTGNLLMTNLTL